MIGNGRKVPFWKDRWVGDCVLLDLAVGSVPIDDREKVVADSVENDGNWDWDLLQERIYERRP